MVPEILSLIVGTGLLAGMYKLGRMLGQIDGKLSEVCRNMSKYEGRLQLIEEVVLRRARREDQ